jgi:holo-[acyl-carrier protein] synthase
VSPGIHKLTHTADILTTSTLASFTADYWGLTESDVTDALTFGASSINKFSSLRFFRFLAALEDTFGVRVDDPASVTSFATLKAAMLGGAAHGNGMAAAAPDDSPAAPAAAPPPPGVAVAGIVAIGHDIEEIDSLPRADDYRTAPFYRSHFTLAEIEYCLRSTNPRQHFAARFCAKEAVRKCGPRFAALDMRSIEVVNTESGQPQVRIRGEQDGADVYGRLLLSMSHSEQLASAFVIVTA